MDDETASELRGDELSVDMRAGALDLVPDPVVITQAVRRSDGTIRDFCIVYANEAAVDLTGRPMSDFIGKTALSVYPTMRRADLFGSWVTIVETGEASHQHALRYEANVDGRSLSGVFDVHTIRFQDGCLHTWHDVSHAHRLQERVDTDREMIHGLSGSIPEPVTHQLAHVSISTQCIALNVFEDIDVGGDWCDAIPVGDRIVLVVGDASGHGLEAAGLMTQLRDVVRAYAVLGLGPAGILTRVNRYVMTLGPGQTATMVCCELDADTGVVRWAHAGHPAPLLFGGGHVRTLTSPDGVMLGVVENFHYGEAVDSLPVDTTLLCFTDGLIESRDAPHNDERPSLIAFLEQSNDTSVEDFACSVVRRPWNDRAADDDVSVLVARRTG
jgi:hypothetical protein